MAQVLDPPPVADLYRKDFYLWTKQQAELLRAGRLNEVDLPNLIEEVESLGRSERRELFSRTQVVLQHLIKLEVSSAEDPRRGWRRTVRSQRNEIRLLMTASLRRELAMGLVERYAAARTEALEDLAEYGETTERVPPSCRYTLDQILDPDWLPENVHGIDDRPPTTAE